MWKGLHEQGVASDHNQVLLTALVENPRVALGLLVHVIVDSYIEACISQLLREIDRSKISVNEIAKFRLPSLVGST